MLDRNVKGIKHPENSPAFRWPGFECEEFPLKNHFLTKLLTREQWQIIDARPRIRPRDNLDPQGNLVDLEHARLADLMLGAKAGEMQQQIPAKWWWSTRAHLSGVLQARTRFRDDPQGHQSYYFRPDEDCTETEFYWLEKTGKETPVEGNLLQRIRDADLFTGRRIDPWSAPDYLTTLPILAEAQGLEPVDCARQFGRVDLPGEEASKRWRYHPALGFSRA